MTEDAAMFLFLAAGAVALFAFLSVAHWIDAGAAERTRHERLALFRKLAETPPETAAFVLEQLRKEDARHVEEKRLLGARTRGAGRLTGLILLAAGTGFGIFLKAIEPSRPAWTLALIPILIGAVVFLYSFSDKPRDPPHSTPQP
jgi:hypothetical protein